MLTNPSTPMPWNVPFQENVSKGSGLGRYEGGSGGLVWRECVWLRGLTKSKVISEVEDQGFFTQTDWTEMFPVSGNHRRGN